MNAEYQIGSLMECEVGSPGHTLTAGRRVGRRALVSALAIPSLWVRHGAGPVLLVVAGGTTYLLGAACFARNWPTL